MKPPNKSRRNEDDNSENLFKLIDTYTFRVFLNILCRALCLLHVISLTLFILYYKFIELNFLFFLPVFSLFAMVIEGFVVIIRHGGKQSKWFSLCMYLYIMSVIPYFWVLCVKFGQSQNEIDRARLQDWPKYLQQAFYILIIFLRVLLPKHKSSREQASNVVKFLLNIVSDAQELQSNVSEFREENISLTNRVQNYEILIYSYLFTWTWSLTLFCLNVDETLEDDDEEDVKIVLNKKEKIINERLDYIDSLMMFRLFRNFYWKFFFVLLLIDLPYLTIRIVGTFYFGKSLPGGYFFAGKNGCQVLLGIHRVICRVWAHNMSQTKNNVKNDYEKIESEEKNEEETDVKK
jgi:hypothetical protein